MRVFQSTWWLISAIFLRFCIAKECEPELWVKILSRVELNGHIVINSFHVQLRRLLVNLIRDWPVWEVMSSYH